MHQQRLSVKLVTAPCQMWLKMSLKMLKQCSFNHSMVKNTHQTTVRAG